MRNNLFNLFWQEEKSFTKEAEKFEELTEKYFRALKHYCEECDRGFDKKIGKIMHMKWRHSDNPPRALKTEQE